MRVTQIILSAITTAGLFFTLFGESHSAIVLSTITSTALLALNTYTKDFDFGELAQNHANTAGDLWYVRESYLSLLTDISGRVMPSQYIREKRDTLQEDLKNIYQSAPRTFPKAYLEAQDALKLNEEMTFSDNEIDVMLPPFLRKGIGQSDQ